MITKIFKNEDGSTGILHIVTNDLNHEAGRIYEIYHKRWRIEGAPQAHKEIKHKLKALCISCTNDGEDPPKSVFRNGLQTTLSCCY
ncbi:hypothetical protein NEOC84_000120|nr:hypothetical protein [Neochlamydia sp. AcF84]